MLTLSGGHYSTEWNGTKRNGTTHYNTERRRNGTEVRWCKSSLSYSRGNG